jgi:hypothetical protein
MSAQAPQFASLLPDWDSSFLSNVRMDVKKTNPFDSDKSVADTVALMGTHANNACGSSQVEKALQEAGANQQGLSEDQIIQRIFSFIKGNITFLQDEDHLRKMFYDPESKELLITPPALLEMNHSQGDCDDFSMLGCAMLMSKGVKCDFVTVAANSSFPREFSHIYCMVRSRDGRNIPFDASHGKEVGWETARAFRKQVWPVFSWAGGSRVGGRRNGKGGMGMVIDGSRASFDTRFKKGLMGLILNNGIGDVDCTTDDDGNVSCSTDVTSTPLMTGVTNVDPSTGIPYDVELNSSSGSTSSSSSSSSAASASTNNLLNSIFNSVSSIVKQVTQQPGTQSTTCNPLTGVCTTSSTVLPTAAQAAAGVSLVSSSLGSILPTLLLIGVGIFALDELGKH